MLWIRRLHLPNWCPSTEDYLVNLLKIDCQSSPTSQLIECTPRSGNYCVRLLQVPNVHLFSCSFLKIPSRSYFSQFQGWKAGVTRGKMAYPRSHGQQIRHKPGDGVSSFVFWGEGDSHAAGGILFPQLEIRPVPPALEAWSLSHWTASGVAGVTVYLPSVLSERSSGSGWGSGDEWGVHSPAALFYSKPARKKCIQQL